MARRSPKTVSVQWEFPSLAGVGLRHFLDAEHPEVASAWGHGFKVGTLTCEALPSDPGRFGLLRVTGVLRPRHAKVVGAWLELHGLRAGA